MSARSWIVERRGRPCPWTIEISKVFLFLTLSSPNSDPLLHLSRVWRLVSILFRIKTSFESISIGLKNLGLKKSLGIDLAKNFYLAIQCSYHPRIHHVIHDPHYDHHRPHNPPPRPMTIDQYDHPQHDHCHITGLLLSPESRLTPSNFTPNETFVSSGSGT